MTDDELIEATRASLVGQDGPEQATEDAVLEAEAAIGFPVPVVLRRLYLEVANGGFGPRSGIMGVRGHEYFTGGDYADIVECYGDGPGEDSGYGFFPGLVSLLDWGCNLWSLCDFRTPEGMMWGWDPHTCCDRHKLFPKNQTVKDWLVDSIATEHPTPFYDGYFDDSPAVDEHGCRPQIWIDGRRANGEDRSAR
jgi:hypothetical protein